MLAFLLRMLTIPKFRNICLLLCHIRKEVTSAWANFHAGGSSILVELKFGKILVFVEETPCKAKTNNKRNQVMIPGRNGTWATYMIFVLPHESYFYWYLLHSPVVKIIINTAVCIVLFQMSFAGLLTGVVVDCGDGSTHISPVWDGLLLPDLTKRLDIGGRDITNYLREVGLDYDW